MSSDPAKILKNVYWIGGATDAGKSTVAKLLAEKHGLAVYHYDSTDVEHDTHLAPSDPEHLGFVNAHLDERWVDMEPPELLQLTLASFRARWSMVVQDIRGFREKRLLAEGFGLLPELLAEVADAQRCIFMVPTPEFKSMSVQNRDKPTWRHQTRDPDRSQRNLLGRDELLAAYVRNSASRLGMPVISVHIDTPPDEMAKVVEKLFGL